MTPFSRVYTRLLEIIPKLEMSPGRTMQATRLIQEWLDKGCDVDLDILPAINKKWAKHPIGVPITSPMYFNDPVIRAMQARLQTDEHKTREEELLAKAYAWKRKHGWPLADHKLNFLAAYEAKNGPIVLEQIAPRP